MTPEEIEAMRRDMEAGREGPWIFVDSVSPCGQEWFGCGVSREGEDEFIWLEHRAELDVPTARRIARVPRLEAAYLAKHDECEALKAENERLRDLIKRIRRDADEWCISRMTGSPELENQKGERMWKTIRHASSSTAPILASAALNGETP